jgi:hypothetical protein
MFPYESASSVPIYPWYDLFQCLVSIATLITLEISLEKERLARRALALVIGVVVLAEEHKVILRLHFVCFLDAWRQRICYRWEKVGLWLWYGDQWWCLSLFARMDVCVVGE